MWSQAQRGRNPPRSLRWLSARPPPNPCLPAPRRDPVVPRQTEDGVSALADRSTPQQAGRGSTGQTAACGDRPRTPIPCPLRIPPAYAADRVLLITRAPTDCCPSNKTEMCPLQRISGREHAVSGVSCCKTFSTFISRTLVLNVSSFSSGTKNMYTNSLAVGRVTRELGVPDRFAEGLRN